MDDVAKAKQRIKKMIQTGERQPRCHLRLDLSKGKSVIYEYKVVHHVKSIFFTADSLGRLRLVEF